MSLNELRDKAYKIADEHGFHENNDFVRTLMLIVSELSEAMEADRKGKWRNGRVVYYGENPQDITNKVYDEQIKGTVEEEIADAIIRLLDLASIWNIDLDWHVTAKMAYNEKREYKHGKKY